MKRTITLILALCLILTLTLWISLVRCPEAAHGQDGGDLPDQNDVGPIMIALTRLDVNDLIIDVNDQTLDVNDQTLELRWKIRNDSDQDVWICSGVGWVAYGDPTGLDYEAYFDEDQTFVIRRRLDVPTLVVYYIWPEGLYVRLRTGEELTESLLLTLPVRPCRMFITPPDPTKLGSLYVARRLVLEVGYHTKDLAQMIFDFEGSTEDPNGYEEAIVPYLSSLNEGENVLRITVDGVHIPYEELWAGYTRAKGKADKQPNPDKPVREAK